MELKLIKEWLGMLKEPYRSVALTHYDPKFSANQKSDTLANAIRRIFNNYNYCSLYQIALILRIDKT